MDFLNDFTNPRLYLSNKTVHLTTIDINIEIKTNVFGP